MINNEEHEIKSINVYKNKKTQIKKLYDLNRRACFSMK
jgi:hypothetical protein